MLLPAKARRLATGGQLGYESQLGNGLGTSTGAAAVGDALYKNLPPLALPFIPVRQAAAVDTAAAVAQADAEGLKQAEKIKDEYMKMYEGATKDARMTAAHRGELARRWDGLMSGLYQDVTKNPAYFGSQSNRIAFQQKALKALDQGDLASYRNQYDALNDKEKRVADAKQQGFKAYINGRRTDYTNQQVFDAARSEGDLNRLGQITGVMASRNGSGNLDFSQLDLGVKTGNEHDALEEFKGHYLELPTSTRGSSGEGYATRKIGSLGQEHIVTSGGGSTRTSNQDKVNLLAAKISSGPEGWRSIGLSEAAQYGLYEPKAAKWDDTALQNPLVITSAQGQAKTLAAGSLTRGQAIQAALEAGDQATYKQLAQLRDQTVGHEISNQLRTQLGLKAVNSLETKQTVSVGGRADDPGTDKSKDWDNPADIAFGGPGFNTSNDQVEVTDVNGKKVAVPVQVKNIGSNPELMKLANFLVKAEDLDAAGKPVERYKNLSELNAHTLYTGSGMQALQGGATALTNPEKFMLRGVTGEVAFLPRDPDAKGQYKQRVAALSAETKRLQELSAAGKITEKEYAARMQRLQSAATSQGFQAFIKVKLGASEEAWKANESLLGTREVKENGKLVSKKVSDYQGFFYNSKGDEATMQQQWNLRPITNTDAMKAQGAFAGQGVFGSNETLGKNAYETDAWLSWDNVHTNGEKKNLRTNATLNEQELQDKQAQTQGMFTAPPFK